MSLREAAQQALEALEWLKVTPDPDLLKGHEWPIRWFDNWVTVTLTPPLLKSRGRATKLRAIQMSLGYQHGAAIAALRAALEELDGRQQTHSTECWRWHHECAISKIQWMHTPLTDAEIDRVTDAQWAVNNHKPIYVAHRAFARAIERAHGIGGDA